MLRSLHDSIIQPSHTKAVIQASIKSIGGSRRVWCVVEAQDDVEVYSKFFIQDVVTVLPSTDEEGRKSYRNVEDIVNYLYNVEDCPRLFGIRDRDYTTFINNYHQPANVFLTDGRDLEMMMFKAPSVIHGLQQSHVDFPTRVKSSAAIMRFLGYLRIYNDIRQTSCIFKNSLTKVSLIWDASNHKVYTDYKERLFSKFHEKCAVPVTRMDFDEFVKHMQLDAFPDHDVCRGHDVCNLLCVMMIKQEYSKVAGLFAIMRDSYSLSDFQNTSLYREILEWSANRGLSIFIT